MLIKGLHLVVAAFGDDIADGERVIRIEDSIVDTTGCNQHFYRRDTAMPVCSRHQALRNDGREASCKRHARFPLMLRWEQVQHAIYRFCCVDGVQGRDDEVSGLCSLCDSQHRLRVPDLAQKHHVGVLAQHVAQPFLIRQGVNPNLALIDQRELVVMHHFDRVFHRHDVRRARSVDVTDHGRDSGRLARTHRTSDQDQPATKVGKIFQHARKVKVGDGGNLGTDVAKRDPDPIALTEHVHAEPPHAGRFETEVSLAGLVKHRRFATRHDLQSERVSVIIGQAVESRRLERAVDPDMGNVARLEVQVAGPLSHGVLQQFDDIDGHGLLARRGRQSYATCVDPCISGGVSTHDGHICLPPGRGRRWFTKGDAGRADTPKGHELSGLGWVIGIVVGVLAGILSGALGVGGGIVTTPAVRLLGGTPIQAIATPLPVIIPTAMTGAFRYWKAGEVSKRAVAWGIFPGAIGAVLGALLTEVIDPHLLLLATAALLGVQSVRIGQGRTAAPHPSGKTPSWRYAVAGGLAGTVSGLLGIGGGIIYVPIATTMLSMPLKRALGTSLVLISAMAIPGTISHALLGNIDWKIFWPLVLGVVPGAWLGAKLALGASEHRLRLAVAAFLMLVAVSYGSFELVQLVSNR